MATKSKEKDDATAPAVAENEIKDAAALAAENEALKAALAQAEDEAGKAKADLAKAQLTTLTEEDAKLVELKVAAGLDRDQAVEVVKAQKVHDATLAGQEEGDD